MEYSETGFDRASIKSTYNRKIFITTSLIQSECVQKIRRKETIKTKWNKDRKKEERRSINGNRTKTVRIQSVRCYNPMKMQIQMNEMKWIKNTQSNQYTIYKQNTHTYTYKTTEWEIRIKNIYLILRSDYILLSAQRPANSVVATTLFIFKRIWYFSLRALLSSHRYNNNNNYRSSGNWQPNATEIRAKEILWDLSLSLSILAIKSKLNYIRKKAKTGKGKNKFVTFNPFDSQLLYSAFRCVSDSMKIICD